VADERLSDRFLSAFTDVERHLKRLAHSVRHESFVGALRRASRTSQTVRSFAEDLEEMAELRNAIVHEYRNGTPIAEPHEETVAQMEAIRDQLLTPRRLFDVAVKPVVCATPDWSLRQALRAMREEGYSTLPVTGDRGVLGVLTAQAITSWFATHVLSERPIDPAMSVERVLAEARDRERYAIVGKKASVHYALELFQGAARKGRDITAVIITEDGSLGRQPVGIVTVHDIPQLRSEAGVRDGAR